MTKTGLRGLLPTPASTTSPSSSRMRGPPGPSMLRRRLKGSGPRSAERRGVIVMASPLAKRIAAERGVDIAGLAGSGPNGRIVKADVEHAQPGMTKVAPVAAAVPAPALFAAADMAEETRALLDARIPHEVEKLSGMRKTIARRLTQSMQQAPHIYLSIDVRLDRLLAMRAEMNAALATRGIKLSVNDMLIKALGRSLIDVPECNVTFAGSEMIRYTRADISVAVSNFRWAHHADRAGCERPLAVRNCRCHERPCHPCKGRQAQPDAGWRCPAFRTWG